MEDSHMTRHPAAAARLVRLLALDVDGVLTDGTLHYGPAGEELKSFSVLDGLGIRLLRRHGMQVAVITARRSAAVERRVTELGIDHYIPGREDKLQALLELLARTGITLAETAYLGDDLPDLAAIMSVGLGMAVANASPEVSSRAHWCSQARGGQGAVREACEMLLRARGAWEGLLQAYLPPEGASGN